MALAEQVELRTRQSETELFWCRVGEIKELLEEPSLHNVLMGLPASPRHLDLFTGTGAGVEAVREALQAKGDSPSFATAVDRFKALGRAHRPQTINAYSLARYALSQDETMRNLVAVSKAYPVESIPQDTLGYLRQVSISSADFPFDLVTAFAAPMHGIDPKGTLDIVACLLLLDTHDPTTVFTFSSKSRTQIPNLQKELTATGLTDKWTIYEKPNGLGPVDWDCWILSNRPLGFKPYSEV